MKVIITGTTGMVGEGVLLECLQNASVEQVLAVSRRPCGHTHPKLRECLVRDFRDLGEAESQLAGYDACFYCAGISSVGLSEEQYSAITYDTPLAFCETLARLNPGMVLVHVSGAHTDATERGKVMWARVKGRAENALSRLPFKAVYHFRPSLMKPAPGQKNIKGPQKLVGPLFPLLNLVFPGVTLNELGRSMLHCASEGSSKSVLEANDIRALVRK